MKHNELELISHPQIKNLNVFLVNMRSRVPHLHHDVEIGLILKGRIKICISSETFFLESGEIYFLNPLTVHDIEASNPDTVILALQFSPQFFNNLLPGSFHARFTDPTLKKYLQLHDTQYEILRALCVELAYSYFCRFQNYEFKCLCLISMIMYILKSVIPCETISPEESEAFQSQASRIQRILSYTDEHYRQKLLLSDIARAENLSLSYISHLFKKMLGITFQAYLQEKRFEHALTLIEDPDQSVLDISLGCGFSDVRYLNQMFLQHYNCSASEYRKRLKRSIPQHKSINSDSQNFLSVIDSIYFLKHFRHSLQHYMQSCSLLDFYRQFLSDDIDL